MSVVAVILGCTILFTHAATFAGGKGQGGIVSRNTEKYGLAPIYKKEDGPETYEYQASRGASVGGITTMGPIHEYLFEKKNDRVQVVYFDNNEPKGVRKRGWMNEKDITKFIYECGCGGRNSKRKSEECSPTAMAGFIDTTWNPCYEEARDKKLEELNAKWEKEVSSRE
jgi:hypothetical protein